MISAKQVLIDAKALIQKHGWIQGSYGNSYIGYCASGAICSVAQAAGWAAAAEAAPVARAAASAVARAAGPAAARAELDIVEYNDAQGRTKEEVLAVFDKAIASLE